MENKFIAGEFGGVDSGGTTATGQQPHVFWDPLLPPATELEQGLPTEVELTIPGDMDVPPLLHPCLDLDSDIEILDVEEERPDILVSKQTELDSNDDKVAVLREYVPFRMRVYEHLCKTPKSPSPGPPAFVVKTRNIPNEPHEGNLLDPRMVFRQCQTTTTFTDLPLPTIAPASGLSDDKSCCSEILGGEYFRILNKVVERGYDSEQLEKVLKSSITFNEEGRTIHQWVPATTPAVAAAKPLTLPEASANQAENTDHTNDNEVMIVGEYPKACKNRRVDASQEALPALTPNSNASSKLKHPEETNCITATSATATATSASTSAASNPCFSNLGTKVPSTALEGEQRTMIENITSLGYRKEKVKEALEAACYNPKNAVLLLKFLKNAFPDKTLDPPASALDDPTKPAAIPEALSKAVAKPAKGYERSKVKTVLVDLLKAALTNSAMSQLISEYREKMECMLQSD